jgi:hypothetical protein
MRSHFRNALAADDRARTQPNPGETYIVCKHVKGNARDGFLGVHVIRTFDGTTRRPFGVTDVMMQDMPAAWWFLCDACWIKHRDGVDDTEVVGYDDVWPEDGWQIEYIEREK